MRRLVFISLEFSAATFSGNGVYARSQVRVCYVVRSAEMCNLAGRQWLVFRGQVRSLCKQQCELLVISGKPVGHAGPNQTEGAAHLIEVYI